MVALVGVPRIHSQASLIAAPAFIDDADPEHDAVIDTVRGRQCAVLNFPAQNSSFLRRVVFGSDLGGFSGAAMDRPALQRLVGVPRSYSRASLFAAHALSTMPTMTP